MTITSPYAAVARMIWSETNGRIFWIVVLALVAGLTEGISVALLIPIIATASPESAAQAAQIPVIGELLVNADFSLPELLAIFVLLVFAQAGLNFLKNYSSLRLMQLVSDKLKRTLFNVLSAATWDAIARRRLPDVNNILSAGVPRCMTAASALVGLVQAMIMIAIYIVLAATVSWQMALFSSVVGAGLFVTMYPIRRMATRYGHELTSLFEKQSRVTLDFLNGVRLAKTFLAEGYFSEAYDRHLRAIRKGTLRFYALSATGTFLFQVSVAVIAACFVYLAIATIELGLGELAVLLVIFSRLTPRFGAIQEQGQQFLSNAPAYQQYQEMVSYFHGQREPALDPFTSPPRFERMISLRAISMRYGPHERFSLDEVDVCIRAGRITALVGPSGSGKSTLADIVAGLVRPTSGEFAVDGVVIDDSNRRAWRSRVATVPQDPFLFDVSLRENLKLAKPNANDEEIWAALDRARIGELIRSLPSGLDTRVGNRGTRFSGGERQRIVVARALLPEPEILILDEATSALDEKNQHMLAKMILELRDDDLSILVIAHQASLTQIADEIIQLESGRIQEATTP